MLQSAQFGVRTFDSMADVAEVVSGYMTGMVSEQQPFAGQLFTNDPTQVFESYFGQDTSVAVSQAQFQFTVGKLQVRTRTSLLAFLHTGQRPVHHGGRGPICG